MNNKVEWSVKISHDFQAVKLYTAGAWLFGDEADETNTKTLIYDLSNFHNDYERGIVEPLYAEVEKIVEDNGFTIIDSWNGLINKALKND